MATTYSDNSLDEVKQNPPTPSSMSPIERSDTPTQSALEYFIASFFQEKNIRWMLVIGAAIVFGSSLMLVTREWSHWPAAVQYLAILGYTGAIYGFAEVGRRRLGLATTAKVMHFLTLLLLPICFLSLSWLTSHSFLHNTLASAEVIALLIPASFLTWFASTRILDNWLRGRQTTFIVSYFALCIAGALPVITNSWFAAIATLALWLVMTAGVVKVNRHVFWIVEEYRTPRIFGFLPIGLLGSLFVLLMASKTWRAIPVEWLGLGCVAVAATMLLTVRSLANVYRQRTGDLVRPLPWNITVPMLVGLILTVLGVLISFYGFSYIGPTTYALIPTTMLAAGLMMVVAKETRQSGFVWSALILATVAYQSTPTLISELVQQLKTSAAQALSEEKLPLAFYGLTYLPLLLGITAGYRYFTSRKLTFVTQPMQQFTTMIALALFVVSFAHPKALFLVSIANIFLFMFFAVTFRDRRYTIPALGGLVLAAATWLPFGNSMGWFDLPLFYSVTSLASLACILVTTRLPDRLIQRIPNAVQADLHCANVVENMCQYLGLFLSFALGTIATTFVLSNLGSAWRFPQAVAFGTILAAACLSTIRTRHYLGGLGFWILASVGLSTWIYGADYEPLVLISGLTFVATTVSLLVAIGIKTAYKNQRLRLMLSTLRKSIGVDTSAGFISILNCDPCHRTSQSILAFVIPLGDLSFLGAFCLTVFVHLPMLVIANTTLNSMNTPFATTMVMLWMLVLGLGFKNTRALVATFATLPLWTTAMLNSVSPELVTHTMFPLVWSLVASAVLLVVERFQTDNLQPAKVVGIAWLAGIVLLSYFNLDLSMRAAGVVSLTTIGFVLRHGTNRLETTSLAILGNIQFLLLTAYLGGMSGWMSSWSEHFYTSETLHLLVPVAGASVLFFDRRWSMLDPIVTRAWAYLLRTAALFGVAVSFLNNGLENHSILIVFVGILISVLAELCEAVRRQKEGHVWSGIAAIGISIIWLAHCNVVAIGAGVSQFFVLAIAIATLTFGERLRGHLRFGVFVRPLQTISLVLPALVTVSALARELMGLSFVWSGFNTLALFSAAGIYFHHGLVTKQRGYHVAAGAIVNVTLALLWNSMYIYDFQFYLVPLGLSVIGFVELLRKELPVDAHDPIRYFGALTILVSPVLQIMNGSWWHLVSLMVLSVLVILLAIGLRVRVLVYTGSAFLMSDMVAMVVRTTIDHPNFLWVGGLGVGIAVITLAAICERHREQLLARIRLLSAELATWK